MNHQAPNVGKNYPGPGNTYGDAMESAFMLDLYMDSINPPPGVADSPWDPYAAGGDANYMVPSAGNPSRYPPHGWPVSLPPETHAEMFLNPNDDQMQQAQHGKSKFPPMQMGGGAAQGTGIGLAPDTSLFPFDDMMSQNNHLVESSTASMNILQGFTSREPSRPSKKRKLTPEEKRQKKLAAQAIAKDRRRERNKVLARKTRAKRKEEMILLMGEVRSLQKENSILRDMSSETLPDPSSTRWLLKCDEDIPGDVVEVVNKMISRAESDAPLHMQAFCVCNALNPKLPIVYASPGFAALTGYAVEEIVGNNCRFLQGPDTDKSEVERIRVALEKGEEVEATLLNYRKDMSTFMNHLKVAPIEGVDKRPILFVGVQRHVDKPQPSSTAYRDD